MKEMYYGLIYIIWDENPATLVSVKARQEVTASIAAGEDFECDFKGASQVGNLGSYV